MNSQREIYFHTTLLSLIGLSLLVFSFLAPGIGQQEGSFFRAAMQSDWRNLLQLPAAWCSLRIILLSISLFLLIESMGTILAVKKIKSLVLPVFLMQVVPCLGLLFGGYYLVKSLL